MSNTRHRADNVTLPEPTSYRRSLGHFVTEDGEEEEEEEEDAYGRLHINSPSHLGNAGASPSGERVVIWETLFDRPLRMILHKGCRSTIERSIFMLQPLLLCSYWLV